MHLFQISSTFFKHIHAYFVSNHYHILYQIIIISRNLSSNEPLTRPLSLGMQHPFVLIQNYISLRFQLVFVLISISACTMKYLSWYATCICSLINLIFQQVLWNIGLGMQPPFVLIQSHISLRFYHVFVLLSIWYFCGYYVLLLCSLTMFSCQSMFSYQLIFQ